MNQTASALAQRVSTTQAAGLKGRLHMESSALAWIAEVLSQSEQASRPTSNTLNADDRDAILRIGDQMQQNPGYEYSLQELCQLSGLNEHKLKSAFKLVYGKTTFSYLRESRMELAARLLRDDRLSVIQVANEVGYTNASHFARAFKERHQLLPKAYQCLHRTQAGKSPLS